MTLTIQILIGSAFVTLAALAILINNYRRNAQYRLHIAKQTIEHYRQLWKSANKDYLQERNNNWPLQATIEELEGELIDIKTRLIEERKAATLMIKELRELRTKEACVNEHLEADLMDAIQRIERQHKGIQNLSRALVSLLDGTATHEDVKWMRNAYNIK